MDIMVKGEASRYFAPDEIQISISFSAKEVTYDKVLESGANCVSDFMNEVTGPLNILNENIKTTRFNVRETSHYDVTEKQYVKDGFEYSQNATLKLDYSVERISEFMEKVSKLKNPPYYTINFKLKNEEKHKSLVIADAYAKAEEKAKMIALAAGKKLKDCIKTDFRPFEESVISNSFIGSTDGMAFTKKARAMDSTNVQQTLQQTFIPEDVCVSETLYCLWITE